MGPSGSLVIKNLPANAGDTADAVSKPSILGFGRSPGVGNDNHSSTLAWRTSWTEEPGGQQSMGLQSWTQMSDCARARAHTHTHTHTHTFHPAPLELTLVLFIFKQNI